MRNTIKSLTAFTILGSAIALTGCGEPKLECSSPEAQEQSLNKVLESVEKNFGSSDATKTKLFVKSMLFINKNDVVCGKDATTLRNMADNPLKKQVDELKNNVKKSIDAGAEKTKNALDALSAE